MTHSMNDITVRPNDTSARRQMNETDAVQVMRFLEGEAKSHEGEARRVLSETAAYLGQVAANGMPTGVEAQVCAMVADRQRKGVAKYGMTVVDNPLALRDWLQHALEEVLDQAVYLKRAIEELDRQPRMFVLSVDHEQDSLRLSMDHDHGSSISDLHFASLDDVIVMRVPK